MAETPLTQSDNGTFTFVPRSYLVRAYLRVGVPRSLRNLAEMMTEGRHLTIAPTGFSGPVVCGKKRILNRIVALETHEQASYTVEIPFSEEYIRRKRFGRRG